MRTCGIILAGGKSSRMGTNKALLEIDNKSVIEHIAHELKQCTNEVVIIANDTATYSFLNLRQISDRYVNKGPLGGLETALHHIDADTFFIAACDMPFINRQVYENLLDQLNNYDAVVPIYQKRQHPLAGIYKRSVLPNIQAQLTAGDYRVRGFFKDIKMKYVDHFSNIPDHIVERHFYNMNNPEEYEAAKVL